MAPRSRTWKFSGVDGIDILSDMLELDDAIIEIAGKLKERGLTSPYLKAFVVARLNPIRFSKATSFDFDEVLEKMARGAAKFNIERIKQEDLARTGGPPPSDE